MSIRCAYSHIEEHALVGRCLLADADTLTDALLHTLANEVLMSLQGDSERLFAIVM